MTVYEELKRRGLIAQCTNEEKVKELLENEKVTFYIGFDATADSLHVGHFLQLIVIKHMLNAGHHPILLLGTGTTMVGDPTGKTDMRKMLTVDEINYNADRFKDQMAKFVDISETGAEVMRNGDWLLKFNYIDLLRTIGVHFSVNKMLTYDCFKTRLERGLSFIEFNYMIMQSYDFLHLYREKNCIMELGGNDQWANILGGVDLVRRVEDKEVYGLTFTLLTTKEGKKMGKTENGAIWLDPAKTSAFDFYQYWRNVDDADVLNCIRMLTFLPMEEIDAMSTWQGSELNKAKEILAYELTKLVHGDEEAEKAQSAAKAVFGSGDSANMPSVTLNDSDFTDGSIDILSMLVCSGLVPSKSEARRAVEQGGVTVDGEKITDIKKRYDSCEFDEGKVLKRGKKNFIKLVK